MTNSQTSLKLKVLSFFCYCFSIFLSFVCLSFFSFFCLSFCVTFCLSFPLFCLTSGFLFVCLFYLSFLSVFSLFLSSLYSFFLSLSLPFFLSACYSKNQASWSFVQSHYLFIFFSSDFKVPPRTCVCLSSSSNVHPVLRSPLARQLSSSAQHSTPPAPPQAPPTQPDAQHCPGTGSPRRYVPRLVQPAANHQECLF